MDFSIFPMTVLFLQRLVLQSSLSLCHKHLRVASTSGVVGTGTALIPCLAFARCAEASPSVYPRATAPVTTSHFVLGLRMCTDKIELYML